MSIGNELKDFRRAFGDLLSPNDVERLHEAADRFVESVRGLPGPDVPDTDRGFLFFGILSAANEIGIPQDTVLRVRERAARLFDPNRGELGLLDDLESEGE